jgi:hypothetical protein
MARLRGGLLFAVSGGVSHRGHPGSKELERSSGEGRGQVKSLLCVLLTGGMSPAPRNLTDKSEWQAGSLPLTDARLPGCIDGSDWLEGEPAAFDTGHDETARLYATNMGVTPSILGGLDAGFPAAAIPMGYTNLSLFEKRAVIADGNLVRIWSQRYEPQLQLSEAGFYAISEGSARVPLFLGLYPSIPHAVRQAEVLSSRMNGSPVIVARLLSEIGWH